MPQKFLHAGPPTPLDVHHQNGTATSFSIDPPEWHCLNDGYSTNSPPALMIASLSMEVEMVTVYSPSAPMHGSSGRSQTIAGSTMGTRFHLAPEYTGPVYQRENKKRRKMERERKEKERDIT